MGDTEVTCSVLSSAWGALLLEPERDLDRLVRLEPEGLKSAAWLGWRITWNSWGGVISCDVVILERSVVVESNGGDVLGGGNAPPLATDGD